MSEPTIPMRFTTHTTKGDAREHWRDQAVAALIGIMVMFAGQAALIAPAWYLNLPMLEVVIQALGFSALWIGVRMAYTIYKYAKV